MGNEHVVPELINRFKNLKGNNFKIQGTAVRLDHLFILMIL